MGKKNKHSKDKLYKTVSELKSHHVGAVRDLELSVLHRRLKFDSCCLSLNTISSRPLGLCDGEGFCYVFDSELIVKFIEKYQVHPIDGTKVSANKLIALTFHKNDEIQYHCPITYKLFNQLSKIVANKKTGHVYSFEAYQQLNLKSNNFKDLLTDEAFEQDDIVWIQDPARADEKWNVTNFYHVKNKLKIDDDSGGSKIRNIEQSSILKASLDEYKLQAETIAEDYNRIVGQNVENEQKQDKLDNINSATYSDGALSRSVTSTVMPVTRVQRPEILNNEQIIYPRIKKKGYVQLITNRGPINLELFCDRTPKTCHNFLILATREYYDNTCFHRLVKNFILQGGDPSGTGSGGQSAWGVPFKDECHGDLKHLGRGVVAMANSGPNTNKSQFYITLRGEWDHLDGKHTVFGRVVGGEETLERIEAVEVDKKDRPKEEIKILRIIKYVDPFEEVESMIEDERKKEAECRMNSLKRVEPKEQPLKKFRSGIGAYIDLSLVQKGSSVKLNDKVASVEKTNENNSSLGSKLTSVGRQRISTETYGDFSGW